MRRMPGKKTVPNMRVVSDALVQRSYITLVYTACGQSHDDGKHDSFPAQLNRYTVHSLTRCRHAAALSMRRSSAASAAAACAASCAASSWPLLSCISRATPLTMAPC